MTKAKRMDRAMRLVNAAGCAADKAWDAVIDAQGIQCAGKKSRKFDRLIMFYFELLNDLKWERSLLLLEETPPPNPEAELHASTV
jgi:hypothetical protein